MTNSEKIRFLVFTTLFGVFWGAAEAFLGSYLHMVHFPFRGALMAGVGASVMCIERFYTPRIGATMATGLAALCVKLISIGGFKLGPVAGILIEAMMVELALSLFGTRRWSLLLACVLCCLEGIPHFFIFNWVVYGQGIFASYMAMIKSIQDFFGFGENLWRYIVLVWIGIHLLIGAAAGLFTIKVAKQLGKYEG